jgi:hypothetical protein
MTKKEAAKFLALVKLAYPRSYKDIDKETALATINMWQASFSSLPYVIMELAFDHYRKTNKFEPTVADMIDELKRLHYEALMDLKTAESFDDMKLAERCHWVMRETLMYKNPECISTNYEAIRERDMFPLPKGDENEIP